MPICIAIDFETSGYSVDSACAIGMIKMDNLQIVDNFYRLIKPPSPIVHFTHIHGLSWNDLKEEQPFSIIWDEAQKFIQNADYFIAHNAAFDRNILYGCCQSFKKERPEKPFLCTLKGSRRVLPLKSKSLNNVCNYLGIALNHHNALSDANGCACVYKKLLSMGLSEKDMMLKDKKIFN